MALAQGLETVLAFIGARIESFSNNSKRIDLACAVVAGLAMPTAFFVLLRISVFRRINPPSFTRIVATLLFSLSCYLVASLLAIWLKSLRRVVPSWVFIAVLGSAILVAAGGIWIRPAILSLSLAEIVSDKLPDALGTIIGLSVFNMPFTAVVYYSGSIVRAVSRWHNGTGQTVSILGEGHG